MSDYIEIVFGLMGGLGLFLLGMKFMSEGMQAVAGARLRRLISSVTDNPVLGVAIGCLVTCIIQSSSITTVMVVGFVNSGFMTLLQAIGVILGACIGTTITGWILTLNVAHYGLPLAGLASLFFMFSNREKVRYWGMFWMGIGLIFFGLVIMSDGLKPLRDHPTAMSVISAFHANTYPTIILAVLIGLVFTAIIQSSSAAIGIAMGLLKTGLIDLPTAAALAMGMNIGTTVTAYLASIGANTNAKRAALAHILFKLFGILWVVPFFPLYLKLVCRIVPCPIDGTAAALVNIDLTRVAVSHTMFNVINTLIFLPFVKPFAALVTRLLPDKPQREAYKLEYLNVRFLAHPSLGIEQSLQEIDVMAAHVAQMLESLKRVLDLPFPDRDQDAEDEIFKRERALDNVQREVTVFLSRMLSDSVTGDVMEEGRRQLRMSHEYESIGDYIMSITKMNIKLVQNRLELPAEERHSLLVLRDHAQGLVAEINRVLKSRAIPDAALPGIFQPKGHKMLHLMKDFRQRHLDTFAQESHNPLMSLVYADMLTAFRRIRDHAVNIAEILGGEK